MKREIGQGTAVVLIVVVIVAIVAGGIGYVIKPTPVPPEIAELEAQVSELEAEVADLEAEVADLESQLAAIPPKPGEGLRFALVSNGGAGDPWWRTVKNGWEAAGEQLGIDVEMYFYNEVPADAVEIMETLTATGVDGIVISDTHPDAIRSSIKNAVDAGITVACIFADDPNSARVAYFGYKYGFYDQGVQQGEQFVDLVPQGAHVLIPMQFPGASYAEERAQGFLDTVGKNVTYEKLEVTTEPATTEERITAYLVGHPETNVIACVGDLPTAKAYKSAEAIGYEPGDIIIVGYGALPEELEGIEAGYIQGTQAPNNYFIAYDACVALFHMVRYEFTPYDITIPNPFIDQTNAAAFAQYSEEGIY